MASCCSIDHTYRKTTLHQVGHQMQKPWRFSGHPSPLGRSIGLASLQKTRNEAITAKELPNALAESNGTNLCGNALPSTPSQLQNEKAETIHYQRSMSSCLRSLLIVDSSSQGVAQCQCNLLLIHANAWLCGWMLMRYNTFQQRANITASLRTVKRAQRNISTTAR